MGLWIKGSIFLIHGHYNGVLGCDSVIFNSLPIYSRNLMDLNAYKDTFLDLQIGLISELNFKKHAFSWGRKGHISETSRQSKRFLFIWNKVSLMGYSQVNNYSS